MEWAEGVGDEDERGDGGHNAQQGVCPPPLRDRARCVLRARSKQEKFGEDLVAKSEEYRLTPRLLRSRSRRRRSRPRAVPVSSTAVVASSGVGVTRASSKNRRARRARHEEIRSTRVGKRQRRAAALPSSHSTLLPSPLRVLLSSRHAQHRHRHRLCYSPRPTSP